MILLNNYQLNELVIGTILFTIILGIYKLIRNSISTVEIIYMSLSFGLIYFLGNLCYNFILFYL